MRRPHLLIGLFLLATVLVDVTVRALSGRAIAEYRVAPMLVALYFSQVSLAALWVGLGRSPVYRRGVGAFLVLMAWSYPSIMSSQLSMRYHVDLSADLAAAVAVPMLVARLLGLRLVRIGELPARAVGRQRWQFSIRYLFGLMTALAIVMGVLQWKAPYMLDPSTYGLWIDRNTASLAAGRALIAWAALWAALGARHAILRGLVLAAATLLAYRLMPLGFFYPWFWPEHRALTVCAESALVWGSLRIFHGVGYRVEVSWLSSDAMAQRDNCLPRLPEPAMIRFVCPHCGAATEVSPEYAGQTGRCPHCRASVTIPRQPRNDSGTSPGAE
jgi:hypothetical protein